MEYIREFFQNLSKLGEFIGMFIPAGVAIIVGVLITLIIVLALKRGFIT